MYYDNNSQILRVNNRFECDNEYGQIPSYETSAGAGACLFLRVGGAEGGTETVALDVVCLSSAERVGTVV